MIPVPAILIDTPMGVYEFAMQGGNVVFITEDDDPQLEGLPNKLKASVLLPPYEATAAELDGDIDTAAFYYDNWLMQKECMDFIELITLAVMKNIPVGIYFGEQLKEMKFPTLFMEFVMKTTGVQFGYGSMSGQMDEQFVPINVGNFLIGELIDVPTFYEMMPVGVDILPAAVQFLAMVLRPLMKPGATLQEYNEYFKDLIKQSHDAGKYLYSPIVSR